MTWPLSDVTVMCLYKHSTTKPYVYFMGYVPCLLIFSPIPNCILIKMLRKFVPKGPIDNKPSIGLDDG